MLLRRLRTFQKEGQNVAKEVVETVVVDISQQTQQRDILSSENLSSEERIHETETMGESLEKNHELSTSWSDVSPAKAGRSGNRTTKVTEVVGSPSRFAVLSEGECF